jgi:small subunit ribosomal protein S16
MLKIRLQRTGRKHEPTFRVVLTDSHNGPKSGKFHEILGSYDPRHKEQTQLKEDRIKYWISKGAQTSGTLHNMFISKKITEGEKINVLPQKTPVKKESDEKAVPAPTPAAAAPVETPTADVPAEEAPVADAPVEEVASAPVAEETPAPAPVEETPSEPAVEVATEPEVVDAPAETPTAEEPTA